MENLKLNAEPRSEVGKNANRRLRARGKIPAVVYGGKMETVNLCVSPKEVLRILRSESGQNSIFTLAYGKESRQVLIRDYQLDPVHGSLLHADFLAVSMDQRMVFEVPVEISGHAPGVQAGGILDSVLREIQVECLPGDVPDHIVFDVSGLEIGDSLRVEDGAAGSGKVTVLSNPGLVVVTVSPPAVQEEEEVEEEVVGAEPEVLAQGKPETEEGESS